MMISILGKHVSEKRLLTYILMQIFHFSEFLSNQLEYVESPVQA